MDDSTLILTRSGLPRQIALVEALADGITPSWTEAVAIVREIATQLHRGGEPFRVPSVEDIALLSNGGLMLMGGRPYPGGPVAGIAVVMAQLLDRDSTPQPVLDIQQQAMSDPPFFESLIDFHNALDFYARPDPQGVLTDYYTRASTAVESGSKNRALEALKEKTKTSTPKEKEPQPKKNKRPALVVAAAVVVASVVAVVAYGMLGSSSSTSAVGQTANAALAAIGETGKKMQDATTEAISKLVGGSTEATPTPAVNASPAEAAVTTRAAAPRGPAATRPSSSESAALPEPRRNPVLVAPSPAPAVAAPIEAPREIPPVDTNVYTAASSDVTPPELVYPQLPSERKEDGTQSQPGELDILVLEDGRVGEARLIPQSNRLQDRMMISAAKAWRFRPALKDGRAVRYRVRIPITW